MRPLAHWFLTLWFLAGILLPGANGYRLCRCTGELQLLLCACEASLAEREGCCSAEDVSPGSGEGAGLSGRVPCRGCTLVSTPDPVPVVAGSTAPMLAPFAFAGVVVRPSAPRLRVAARIGVGRAHDPPGSRRNRELRV